MNTFLLENEDSHFTLRHRAICNTCSFNGPWRNREYDAEVDADTHAVKPGNEDHIVKIVTEQTLTKPFHK
jgi:hypothetical protein